MGKVNNILKFFKEGELEDMIEAFNGKDQEWHEEEWQEFIYQIRHDALEELRHELDEFPEPYRGLVFKKINKLQNE